jgi:hypothetical protein
VIVRPYRPGPRYVFKDADPRNDYITRVAERPRDASDNRRPAIDRGRTSADIGGRGTIPAPVSPRRRVPDSPDRTAPSVDPRRPSARQPSGQDRLGTPDVERSPRRRTEAEHPGDPGTLRDVPPPSQDDQARRRPHDDRIPRTSEPTRRTPDREPSQNAPRTREPRQTPGYREPSREAPRAREPSREAPRVREPSREPSRSPSADRPKSEPRSTGEPELRRRRP